MGIIICTCFIEKNIRIEKVQYVQLHITNVLKYFRGKASVCVDVKYTKQKRRRSYFWLAVNLHEQHIDWTRANIFKRFYRVQSIYFYFCFGRYIDHLIVFFFSILKLKAENCSFNEATSYRIGSILIRKMNYLR